MTKKKTYKVHTGFQLRVSPTCSRRKLIQQESIRIVFSGKKGFHIEIKPDIPVDAQVFRTELIQGAARILDSKENLDGWNMFFESTTLDRFHDFIRLTGSVNSWRTSGGELLRRRMTQLGVKEFPQLSIRWLLEQTTLPSLRLGN